MFETFFFCFVDKLFFLIAIQIAVFGLLLAPLRRLICRENLSKLFSFLSSSFLAIRLGYFGQINLFASFRRGVVGKIIKFDAQPDASSEVKHEEIVKLN